MGDKPGTGHIVQSLVANLAIAITKGVAALFTGSGTMLAETLHSAADCGNQMLLLLGVRQSRRPPSAKYPLGQGRELYFWSFMVALLLFTGGGVFSVYEGIHKIRHPEPLEKAWLAIGILFVSLLIEGAATLSNVKEINKRRGDKALLRYLRDTKDSDLVVVFGENLAASLGLLLAMMAVGMSAFTGNTRWDGVGSLLIGVVLVGVAVFLAVEVKSLLVGEVADPEIEAAARKIAVEDGNIDVLLSVITVQQGPGEVLVALKVRVPNTLSGDEVAKAINRFEAAIKAERPEVKWLFVEPDLR